jgi:hypothetical protein
MTKKLTLFLVALGARVAAAHIVPIDPSLCTFDPVSLSVPATGATGSAAAPRDEDALRIVYDTGSSEATFCPAVALNPRGSCGVSVPRAFTLGAVAGTLTFPPIFRARMFAGGDLELAGLSVGVDVGGVSASVPVTFTSGLAAADDMVVEGAPFAGFGEFHLVGVARDGLPPPLAGQTLVLGLSCMAVPAPDVDQFAQPARVTSFSGRINGGKGRLRAVVDAGAAGTPVLGAAPLLVRLASNDTSIAAAVVSGAGDARRWRGMSADGRVKVVVRTHATSELIVTLNVRHATPPAVSGRVLVQVTLDLAGTIARGETLFHATHGGRALRS